MRGVLVDDDQPVLGLGDDVGRRDLAARDSEREARHRFDRRFGAAAGASVEEALIFAHTRHSRESGSPAAREGSGTPAFAGMTSECGIVRRARGPHHRRRGLLARGAALAFLVERVAQAADDQPAHRRRIAEADLGLGRVDVDVDLLERDVEEQGGDRMAVAGDAGRDRRRAARRPAAGPSPAAR